MNRHRRASDQSWIANGERRSTTWLIRDSWFVIRDDRWLPKFAWQIPLDCIVVSTPNPLWLCLRVFVLVAALFDALRASWTSRGTTKMTKMTKNAIRFSAQTICFPFLVSSRKFENTLCVCVCTIPGRDCIALSFRSRNDLPANQQQSIAINHRNEKHVPIRFSIGRSNTHWSRFSERQTET